MIADQISSSIEQLLQVGTEDLEVEVLLVAEVHIDHPLVDARVLGDFVDTGAVEALGDEGVFGGCEELEARGVSIALARGGFLGGAHVTNQMVTSTVVDCQGRCPPDMCPPARLTRATSMSWSCRHPATVAGWAIDSHPVDSCPLSSPEKTSREEGRKGGKSYATGCRSRCARSNAPTPWDETAASTPKITVADLPPSPSP